MRIAYYAEDGMEFDNEHECENYEKMKDMRLHNFCSHLYDENGNEISITDVKVGQDNIDYLDIRTQEDWELIRDILEDKYGTLVPEGVGKWWYNYERDCWETFESIETKYLFMCRFF